MTTERPRAGNDAPTDGPPAVDAQTTPSPAVAPVPAAPAATAPQPPTPQQSTPRPAVPDPAPSDLAPSEPAPFEPAPFDPPAPAGWRRRLRRLLSRLPHATHRTRTGGGPRPDVVVGDAAAPPADPAAPTGSGPTGSGATGSGATGSGITGSGATGSGTGGATPGTTATADAALSTDATQVAERIDTAVEPAALTSVRPPGVPPDPWTAFATTPERQPGRLRRAVRAVGRALVHEYALVCYAALVLAVAMTWPALRYPLHTLPQDLWDPSVQAWQIAWTGHSLLTDPAQLWQANAFFPERFTLVYSDSLLGYAPLGMIGSGATAAVLRYNLVFVAAHALLFIGAYALVRQLGAGRTGAAVAAMAFAYAPWRLAQEGHLPILSAGGIPLAFAMLARGHGWSLRYGFRPRRRHVGWVVAGWAVATWQFSLGLALGLPLAYALAVVVVIAAVAVAVRRLRRRAAGPVLGRRILVADGLGMLVFAGIGLLLALPYLRVALLYPDAGRTDGEIAFFSAPVHSLFVAPAESRIWGAAHSVPRASLPWAPEMTLLPGFTLYALALAGLLFSLWSLRQRLLLLFGVLVTAVLSLGTTFLGGRWTYLPLFAHAPTWTGLRTPGLLVLWPTLLLGVLAAGAAGEFVRRTELMAAQRVPPWPGPWARGATLVPLLLVAVEGLGATPHPVVPDQPAALRTVDGPLLVLPSDRLGDQVAMLWSTSKFQPLANGGAGFVPRRQEELRRATASFPDAASIQYLRGLGVKRVVLLREKAVDTPWERAGDVPVDTLGIQREDLADAVVFRLS